MAELQLHLSSLSNPELIKSFFRETSGDSWRVCIRGKTGEIDLSFGTFQWTSAVRALTLLIVRNAAFTASKENLTTRYFLSGESRSPAASLDYALSKENSWLVDMFGISGNGQARAKRLFVRSNPERKRIGPVEISLNLRIWNASNLAIYVDNKIVSSSSNFNQIITFLEQSWTKTANDKTNSKSPKQASQFSNTKDSKISDPKIDNLTSSKPIVIGESDLIVVKSITTTWNLDKLFESKGLFVNKSFYHWSDSVLAEVNAGTIDIALYNKEQTKQFMRSKSCSSLDILCDFGCSMSGKNFYILAKKGGKWKPNNSIASFRKNLTKGSIIALPSSNDMLVNLLQVLKTTEEQLTKRGIKLIPSDPSNPLKTFDGHPDLLLIHGQNIRFQAIYRGEYFEVINFDSIEKDKQQQLINNAKNCVIYNKRLLDLFTKESLLELVGAAKKHFYTIWSDPKYYSTFIPLLIEQVTQSSQAEDAELQFVIEQILCSTYNF